MNDKTPALDANIALGHRTTQAVSVGEELHQKIDTFANALDQWVDTAKNDGTVTPATLAVMYFHMKSLYEDIDKAVKRIYHANDALNKFLIPERLRANNLDGIRVPEIARSFGIVEKTSASFLDKDAGLKWLRDIGQGDMIQETVNAGTLASFCRNMILEQGMEPPEDVVKVSTYSTTSMVKYRPKGGE